MTKSDASRKLEEIARKMPGSYDDFVRYIGTIPQKYGVDEELLRYAESFEHPDYDDVSIYMARLILREKEKAQRKP